MLLSNQSSSRYLLQGIDIHNSILIFHVRNIGPKFCIHIPRSRYMKLLQENAAIAYGQS